MHSQRKTAGMPDSGNAQQWECPTDISKVVTPGALQYRKFAGNALFKTPFVLPPAHQQDTMEARHALLGTCGRGVASLTVILLCMRVTFVFSTDYDYPPTRYTAQDILPSDENKFFSDAEETSHYWGANNHRLVIRFVPEPRGYIGTAFRLRGVISSGFRLRQIRLELPRTDAYYWPADSDIVTGETFRRRRLQGAATADEVPSTSKDCPVGASCAGLSQHSFRTPTASPLSSPTSVSQRRLSSITSLPGHSKSSPASHGASVSDVSTPEASLDQASPSLQSHPAAPPQWSTHISPSSSSGHLSSSPSSSSSSSSTVTQSASASGTSASTKHPLWSAFPAESPPKIVRHAPGTHSSHTTNHTPLHPQSHARTLVACEPLPPKTKDIVKEIFEKHGVSTDGIFMESDADATVGSLAGRKGRSMPFSSAFEAFKSTPDTQTFDALIDIPEVLPPFHPSCPADTACGAEYCAVYGCEEEKRKKAEVNPELHLTLPGPACSTTETAWLEPFGSKPIWLANNQLRDCWDLFQACETLENGGFFETCEITYEKLRDDAPVARKIVLSGASRDIPARPFMLKFSGLYPPSTNLTNSVPQWYMQVASGYLKTMKEKEERAKLDETYARIINDLYAADDCIGWTFRPFIEKRLRDQKPKISHQSYFYTPPLALLPTILRGAPSDSFPFFLNLTFSVNTLARDSTIEFAFPHQLLSRDGVAGGIDAVQRYDPFTREFLTVPPPELVVHIEPNGRLKLKIPDFHLKRQTPVSIYLPVLPLPRYGQISPVWADPNSMTLPSLTEEGFGLVVKDKNNKELLTTFRFPTPIFQRRVIGGVVGPEFQLWNVETQKEMALFRIFFDTGLAKSSVRLILELLGNPEGAVDGVVLNRKDPNICTAILRGAAELLVHVSCPHPAKEIFHVDVSTANGERAFPTGWYVLGVVPQASAADIAWFNLKVLNAEKKLVYRTSFLADRQKRNVQQQPCVNRLVTETTRHTYTGYTTGVKFVFQLYNCFYPSQPIRPLPQQEEPLEARVPKDKDWSLREYFSSVQVYRCRVDLQPLSSSNTEEERRTHYIGLVQTAKGSRKKVCCKQECARILELAVIVGPLRRRSQSRQLPTAQAPLQKAMQLHSWKVRLACAKESAGGKCIAAQRGFEQLDQLDPPYYLDLMKTPEMLVASPSLAAASVLFNFPTRAQAGVREPPPARQYAPSHKNPMSLHVRAKRGISDLGTKKRESSAGDDAAAEAEEIKVMVNIMVDEVHLDEEAVNAFKRFVALKIEDTSQATLCLESAGVLCYFYSYKENNKIVAWKDDSVLETPEVKRSIRPQEELGREVFNQLNTLVHHAQDQHSKKGGKAALMNWSIVLTHRDLTEAYETAMPAANASQNLEHLPTSFPEHVLVLGWTSEVPKHAQTLQQRLQEVPFSPIRDLMIGNARDKYLQQVLNEPVFISFLYAEPTEYLGGHVYLLRYLEEALYLIQTEYIQSFVILDICRHPLPPKGYIYGHSVKAAATEEELEKPVELLFNGKIHRWKQKYCLAGTRNGSIAALVYAGTHAYVLLIVRMREISKE